MTNASGPEQTDPETTRTETAGTETTDTETTAEKAGTTDGENSEIFGDYDTPRPTAVLPGSDGTVTGTAVNDWLDDDGNPIYGQDKDT